MYFQGIRIEYAMNFVTDEGNMAGRDLAKKEHWDNLYADCKITITKKWFPKIYLTLVIEHILSKEITRNNPNTILEIGCGNSIFLPYVAKTTNAQVTGIDYSEEGCQLALQRLNMEGVSGEIICKDIINVDHEMIGKYDFVYSLGVVEHYSDLNEILKEELKFVKPGGVLLTEIPNLNLIPGLLVWIYQPELLAKHQILSKTQLIKAYEDLGLSDIKADYAGLFSLGVVVWGKYPRWKRLSEMFLPVNLFFLYGLEFFLSKTNCYRGFALTAPYIYVIGTKKETP
jgi:2-polyprenyl-3-methyl-5-hydroxy-6-metoxy-1,4-benzoquinol methylase